MEEMGPPVGRSEGRAYAAGATMSVKSVSQE